MGSKLNKVIEKELIHKGAFPQWLQKANQYECITGSVAHAVSSDISDLDIMGFCIPRKDLVFPHLAGKLYGFDNFETFNEWQMHGVKDPSHKAGKSDVYDFKIYGITKYFLMLLKNNSQVLESLFAPQDCVLHCTPVAGMVRARRKEFLHKGSFHSFTGYAHSQMAKLDRTPIGNRKAIVDRYGFDTKYAAAAVRLADMCDQVLELGEMDIRRPKEFVKQIRKGEVPLDEIKKWMFEKMRYLQNLYEKSKLPNKPNKLKIKQLLLDCLEQHYGNLTEAEIATPDKNQNILNEIRELVR